MRLLATLVLLLATGSSFAQDVYERMYRNLQKKVTVEFVDTKLTDCIELVQALTNVNIVVHPRIRVTNPVVNLKVKDMDAATLIKWLTELTETHADLKDQAIFISDKPDVADAEEDKNALAIRAAVAGVQVDLPPPGQPLTQQDIVKVAMALFEKENVKPTDFPGPNLQIGEQPALNPFGQ